MKLLQDFPHSKYDLPKVGILRTKGCTLVQSSMIIGVNIKCLSFFLLPLHDLIMMTGYINEIGRCTMVMMVLFFLIFFEVEFVTHKNL